MRLKSLPWIIFMVFFCITLFSDVMILAAHGQCRTDQKMLLLRLNLSLVNWNQDTDCCNWDGVSCNSNGYVVGIDLSEMSEKFITGKIEDSSSLFDLQYLQSLNLGSNNNFRSEFPLGFSKLTNLKYLNLSKSGFYGQIPVEISYMKKLTTLDLSSLSIGQPGSLELANPNLSTLIQNLTELTDLRLDGIDLSSQGTNWCRVIATSLPKLEVLSLSSCRLSGPMDVDIGKLQNLSVLRLNRNNLSGSVPDIFANFSNLRELHLSSCELNGSFPANVFQVRSLEIIDLSNNEFLHGTLPDFDGSSAIRNLVLSDTGFYGALPESIGANRNLSRIELALCNFTGPIPSSVANLTELVYLDLSSNEFTGQIPSFRSSPNLTYIDLSRNQITGGISSPTWQILVNLVYLDLKNNTLTGGIPLTLFMLPLLQKLRVSYNQFSGKLEIPNAASSSLDTLDLSSNILEGPIPESIFQLKNLKVLLLSSNKFNGSIELTMLWNLKNLTTVELSYNNLSVKTSITNSTSLPQISRLKLAACNMTVFPDLSNQKNLIHLDLSDNQISGAIQNWVWKLGNGSLQHLNLSCNSLVELQENHSPLISLPSISVLDLHYNLLNGKIPNPPPMASYVDFSSNNFSSSIPTDIGSDIAFTYFLSLSNNQLTGTIPESICNSSYLQVLDLSNNSLSGTIPSCLINRSSTLVALNLRENRFNGSISDTFPKKCTLQTFDVNGNQIEGRLPESLANCANLEVVDFGNNQIRDVFPCILKNISSLRVLVLRVNKFYGDICCQMNNGSWPMLQIVDLASNNFSGNLPEKYLKTWKAMMVTSDEAQPEVDHLQYRFLPLNRFYYQDSVTVTSKGLSMEIVKILTVFTSIDFSLNNFSGTLPSVIGDFKALRFLNLSYNTLTGEIPSSFGNLQKLESLDLSNNNLKGQIPYQLAGLNFLAYLNLSYNQLEGPIPTSTQFGTFEETSFEGNDRLCGSPTKKNCTSTRLTPPTPTIQHEISRDKFNWQLIFIGLGFGVGAATVMPLFIVSNKAGQWVDDGIDNILVVILPIVGLVYEGAISDTTEPDGSSEDNTEETYDEDEEPSERYCVFCTKLDITGKRVIHDSHCTCDHSPNISSYSLSS